jgi:hypothetical protein
MQQTITSLVNLASAKDNRNSLDIFAYSFTKYRARERFLQKLWRRIRVHPRTTKGMPK